VILSWGGRVIRALFENLGLKLMSLLVAIVLWAAAQGFQSVDLSLDLPISLEDVPDDLVVVDQSVSEVNVMLQGSRAAVRWAKEDLQRFPISLAGRKPGRAQQFLVDPKELDVPRGAEIVARSPSMVELHIEPVIRKRVRISSDVVGSPPEGYALGRVTATPAEILLEGARDRLRRLTQISTKAVDLSELRETTTLEVPLAFPTGYIWRANDAPPILIEIAIRPPDEPVEGNPK
jgi:YbbR domain-containing protein